MNRRSFLKALPVIPLIPIVAHDAAAGADVDNGCVDLPVLTISHNIDAETAAQIRAEWDRAMARGDASRLIVLVGDGAKLERIRRPLRKVDL